MDAGFIGDVLQKFIEEEVFRRILADSNGKLKAGDDPAENLAAERKALEIISANVDVIAGPPLHEVRVSFDREMFERIITEVVRRVWQDFESFE